MTSTTYHEAGTLTVKGVSHDVKVGDDGNWYTWLNQGNDKVSAPTKDELAKQVARETRKATASIAVPFTSLDATNAVARCGVATGIHGSSHNVLVRWADTGQAEQLHTLGGGTVLGGLSDAEVDEWEKMRRQYLEISRLLFAFERAHKIDLRDAVRKALAAAVAGDETS